MNIAGLFLRPLYWLAGKLFSIWARPAIQPDAPAGYITDSDAAVCYVLETGGLADLLALERACIQHGMPSPTESFDFCGKRFSRRYIVLRRRQGVVFRRPSTLESKFLRNLVETADRKCQDLLLIPTAIYWGRSPHKERSVLKILFSENWNVAGRTRKLFATFLHGRNTLLRFSHALPLSSIVQEGLDTQVAFRKVSRILRVHFRKRRTATVGPDLSHRRTLLNQVLRDPTVRRAIRAEIRDDPNLEEPVERKARAYAHEIAANISYPIIRIAEGILKWLWHRIYDGIELNHIERIHELAKDKEIVYVPCHRSHFDYLLLAYIVYEQGLQLPHVAAGINLNIPIIGGILRRGGAFYLRRSFKGNRLYAAVFDAYLQQILARGHSIEYFVEGGRSRTGRLLPPKGGMLAMTVNAYVKNPKRPIVFVPVYFGYEKLIEGDSFINELGGATKQKESLFGLIKSIKSLRENFGKAYVNIADPIDLEPLLDQARCNWREAAGDNGERPAWLGEVVDNLGQTIMSRINSAAAVTPISLLAYVLLATPKQTMGAEELKSQLRLSMSLMRRFRYSGSVTIPDLQPDEIIAHGEHLGAINRRSHPMGDFIHMPEHTAVLMTYFRNNILHLLAVPASVACCFIQGRQLEHAELQRLIDLIYPFMQKELYLRWPLHDIADVTTEAIEALVEMGLLKRGKNKSLLIRPHAGSAGAFQLLMLGQTMVPMLQRFYLVIAILVRNGSGTLSPSRLEKMCELSAERLSVIYGLHSPDFFNRSLFQDFIRELQDQDVLRRNSDGLLEFDEGILSIGNDARLVLGEAIRHSILSLTVSEDQIAA